MENKKYLKVKEKFTRLEGSGIHYNDTPYYFSVDEKDLSETIEILKWCKNAWETDTNVMGLFFEFGDLLDDQLEDIPHEWLHGVISDDLVSYSIEVEDRGDLLDAEDNKNDNM